jgi:hypothetical protein
MPPRKISFRLVLAASVTSLAAVAVFCAISIVLVRHQLRGSFEPNLREQAVEVAQLDGSAFTLALPAI